MREIEFRVFDKKEGVYFGGWDGSDIDISFKEDDKDGVIGFIQYKDLGCSCNPDDACGGCVDVWQHEPLTKDSIIEQYTGLCDKNGVKIFEGDITDLESGYIAVIGWNKETASFCAVYDGGDSKSDHLYGVHLCEIIGDIHTTPELLK